MTKQITKHSPSIEPMKMIMNPKTGKMVQAGGQLGKKLIRNYNADKIYNPLTGKQVLTGGSVGKKVLGLYKEGGQPPAPPPPAPPPPPQPQPPQNAKVFECKPQESMNVYLLFRSMKRKEIETNSIENITPRNCSSKMTTGTLKLNTCKTGIKREWLPHITQGLNQIFSRTDLNKLMKNDTFWEKLQTCYDNGEKLYNTQLAEFLKQPTYTFKIDPNSSPQSPKSETYKFNVINNSSNEETVGEGTVVIIKVFEYQNIDKQEVYKRTFTIDLSSIPPSSIPHYLKEKYETSVRKTTQIDNKFDDYKTEVPTEATFINKKGLFSFPNKKLNPVSITARNVSKSTTDTVQNASCPRLDTTKLNQLTNELKELYTAMGTALACVDHETMKENNSSISYINNQIEDVIKQIDKLDEKNEYTHEIHRMIDRLVKKITSQNPTSSGGKKKHKGKKCGSK
jgi:hypothetical protein